MAYDVILKMRDNLSFSLKLFKTPSFHAYLLALFTIT